jgi:hypothetical protein
MADKVRAHLGKRQPPISRSPPMADPQRLKDDHPRRAEPLQPDKPGSGKQSEATDNDDDASARTVQRQKEQSDAALDNVSKGYD